MSDEEKGGWVGGKRGRYQVKGGEEMSQKKTGGALSP